MIDKFEREYRLIYAIIVAGKSAKFAEGVMARLITGRPSGANDTPFNRVREWVGTGTVMSRLRVARSGNYRKTARCLTELVARTLDLSICTPAQLEEIHGIGPKTSRFFILWTRPGERYAALDVHVLRWMGRLGYDVPRATPTGEKYRKLEEAFLKEADQRGLTPGELDSKIWDEGSRYSASQKVVENRN